MSMETTVEAEPQKAVIRVKIPKAGIELDVYPDEVPMLNYEQIWRKGCQQELCRNMTKITKAAYPDPEELKARALEIAQQNLEDLYAGRVAVRGVQKEGKASREVMKEARRIAKELVKKQLKDEGYKISYVDGKDITKAANALLASDPEILEMAKAEVERISSRKSKIDISGIRVSDKKVAAAKKRKDDATLSANQAARVVQRARPTPTN